MATPNAATATVGSQTKPARIIMEQPNTQITCPTTNGEPRRKDQPIRTTVNSRKISQSPRVQRKRDRSDRVLPRVSERNAPVPARKTKMGAQKCVAQRVKN